LREKKGEEGEGENLRFCLNSTREREGGDEILICTTESGIKPSGKKKPEISLGKRENPI